MKDGLEVLELTAPAAGGVAVLSIRGVGALERVRRLAPAAAASSVPRLVRLVDGDQDLDEALLVVHSESHLELHLHGSPPLVERVRGLLAGPAGPEGALGLEQRAQELLVQAPSEDGARMLLDQAEGALRRELQGLLELPAMSRTEGLAHLIERGRVARRALEWSVVVLAGPVNAGKSTLFNALCGEGRAIVSSSAGTTRDLLRQRLHLGPWPVELLDAPGERSDVQAAELAAGVALELEGLELAQAQAERADLVLWLCPAPAPKLELPPQANPAHWRLLVSRADLLEPGQVPAEDQERLSAHERPEEAAALVERLLREVLGLPDGAWTPGAAVPFEAWQLTELELARSEGSDAPIERVLEACFRTGSTPTR